MTRCSGDICGTKKSDDDDDDDDDSAEAVDATSVFFVFFIVVVVVSGVGVGVTHVLRFFFARASLFFSCF